MAREIIHICDMCGKRGEDLVLQPLSFGTHKHRAIYYNIAGGIRYEHNLEICDDCVKKIELVANV